MTFDFDWANDGVFEDFLDLIESKGITGTLHVTHKTELLKRAGQLLELGIHPNFNKLLCGEDHFNSYLTVMKEIKEIVPNAVSLRSHALTNSSIITAKYADFGIKYDLNTLIPAYNGLRIRPYRAPVNGNVLSLPFIFEDDIYLGQSDKRKAEYYLSDEFDAPRIFNFHPIHLFLNTDTLATYEKARPYFGDYNRLKQYVNTERYGIRDFFCDLVGCAKEAGYSFQTIREGRWE